MTAIIVTTAAATVSTESRAGICSALPPKASLRTSLITHETDYFRCATHPRATITGPNSEARSSDVSEFRGDD